MKKFLILFLLFSSFQLWSQKEVIHFGIMNKEDIALTKYDKDKDATAVVLYDFGRSEYIDHYEDGYHILFTRHKRIKILDKAGIDHGTISIFIYVGGDRRKDELKSIEAVTYNFDENGHQKTKPLDLSTVYEEKINEHLKRKVFAFPDVQEGSILELKYQIESQRTNVMPDWEFQCEIPTLYSEYEVRLVPFWEFVYIAQGINTFDFQNSYTDTKMRGWGSTTMNKGMNVVPIVEFQDVVHNFVLRDIPAFEDESYITSKEDYIIKMDFQLAKFHSPNGRTKRDIMSTWPELNHDLLKYEHFGKFMNKCSRYAKKILGTELKLDGLFNEERSIKVVEWVKNNFHWDGRESKYSHQTAKEFFTNKTGNSAEINLFLTAMLREANVQADPVILSSRSHGKIKTDYPFDHFTNYVIVLVNTTKPYLADATEKMLPYNMLPPRCFNEKAVIVNDEKEASWVQLENQYNSKINNTISITFDSLTMDGDFRLSIQSENYKAFELRKKFLDKEDEIREFYEKKAGSIDKCKTLFYDKISAPYNIFLEGRFESEQIGSLVAIKPFLNLPMQTNKLKQKHRQYPVDFVQSWEESFESSIKIPKGYKINSLPENYSMNNKLADIQLDFTEANGFLKATGSYKFKKAKYSPEEYPRIKAYFQKIIDKFNEAVVLEKE